MKCVASTQTGARCRNRPLPGQERCRLHVHVPDPALVDQLIAMLRSGAYLDVALVAAGVVPNGDLSVQLERARAEGEIRNVALIANAARSGAWAAAAWLLERQYPERWGRSIRPVDVPAPAPAASERDSLDDLALRRETRRRQLT